MNGPKVRQVLKSAPVSQTMAHKLISRFLDREGQEEILLNENLTRLQSICQSMGGGRVQTPQEAPKATPISQLTPENPGAASKRSSHKTADEEINSNKKKKSRSEKSAEKEAKKSAKKERKEKRKREESEASGKKKRRKTADS
jgi:hypothetical protein